MKTLPVSRIQDLIGLVHSLYPPSLAEEWDSVGLQVGDPAAPLTKTLICLDPSLEALNLATELGAEALLCHHPLLFRPLKNIVPQDEAGRLVLQAVRARVAVVSVHTNLDRGLNGLNDWLAADLGLQAAQPLALGAAGGLLKLVVFVPAGYEGKVADALFAAGAGRLGHYDRVAFGGEGTGSFRPETGAAPFLGQIGVDERVREIRLETLVPSEILPRVLAKMRKAHPYEEVAFDLLPLANQRTEVGLGRIGRLTAPTTLAEFALEVKQRLGLTHVRRIGDGARPVHKVAVCGGSGASLLGEAVRQGADVLVTGDVKYHEARSAEARGLAVIDAGHFGSEHLMVKRLCSRLSEEGGRRGLPLEFVAMEGERDPFCVV